MAVELLQAKQWLEHEFSVNYHGDSPTMQWTSQCHDDVVGALIGRQGHGLQALRQLTGAKVYISQRDQVRSYTVCIDRPCTHSH
jgi:predicted RNA-binding protein YlqC (UPF0109 family)